jgi:hypothetical protein
VRKRFYCSFRKAGARLVRGGVERFFSEKNTFDGANGIDNKAGKAILFVFIEYF